MPTKPVAATVPAPTLGGDDSPPSNTRVNAAPPNDRSASPDEPPSRFPAMRSRNFRLLWVGLFIGNIGTLMATTAEQWLVTDLYPNRQAFSLGLIAVSFAIPMLILPPIGGAMADRVPRMRVLWGAQIGYLALAIILTIITYMDLITLGLLMAYAAGQGIILAFDNPTRQALVPDLVSRSALTSAISLNASVFTGAALVGPAVARAMLPLIEPGGVFAFRAVLSLVAIGAIAQMRGVPVGPAAAPGARVPVRTSMTEGARYILSTPLILTLLGLSLISGLFGRSYGPLLAVFAREVFSVGSFWFGVMIAAPGLGTLVGSIWLASRGDIGRKSRWIAGGSLAFSVLLLVFALTDIYAVALPLQVLAGLCSTIATALIAALIQLRVPPRLRGRVMSYYTLTLIGVPSLGALVVGSFAELVGVRVAVGGAAIAAGLLTIAAFALNRELREAD